MKITSCDCFKEYNKNNDKYFIDVGFGGDFIVATKKEKAGGKVMNTDVLTGLEPVPNCSCFCPICGKRIEVSNED